MNSCKGPCPATIRRDTCLRRTLARRIPAASTAWPEGQLKGKPCALAYYSNAFDGFVCTPIFKVTQTHLITVSLTYLSFMLELPF